MRILDRQRYWDYLKAYVICFVSLVGIYVVFDAFSNADEFTKIHDSTLGLLARMGRFYLIRTSLFYDRLCGVIGMMAAIFTVTWMQRNNELLAMMAAGISTPRTIRPVAVSAVLVSAFAIVNQEWIMPPLGPELQLDHADDGKRALVVHARTDLNGIGIHGGEGIREAKTLVPFDATLPITRFDSLNLEAKEARYIPETDQRSPLRGGWLLRGARFPPEAMNDDHRLLVEVPPEDLKDFPPSHGDPAKLTGPAYFLRSNVTFEVATRSLQWYWFASTPELMRTLREPIGNTERTEISTFLHARNLRPLTSLTLLLLSLPLVLGGGSGGMFLNLGLSLGTSALFYSALFVFGYLSNNHVLWPELAAWAPLFLFGTLAVSRWDRIRT